MIRMMGSRGRHRCFWREKSSLLQQHPSALAGRGENHDCQSLFRPGARWLESKGTCTSTVVQYLCIAAQVPLARFKIRSFHSSGTRSNKKEFS